MVLSVDSQNDDKKLFLKYQRPQTKQIQILRINFGGGIMIYNI